MNDGAIWFCAVSVRVDPLHSLSLLNKEIGGLSSSSKKKRHMILQCNVVVTILYADVANLLHKESSGRSSTSTSASSTNTSK